MHLVVHFFISFLDFIPRGWADSISNVVQCICYESKYHTRVILPTVILPVKCLDSRLLRNQNLSESERVAVALQQTTMAPKSKSIFRQPGTQHFQLVHRSQRDPLSYDPEASSHVLKSIVKVCGIPA